MKYNPEKRAWRGISYKNGRSRIREMRDVNHCGTDYSEIAHLVIFNGSVPNIKREW